ncbi:hypothetical protein CROQUDRAFT_660902 [Cronartium quercuum f. sp. fusiforme G11]|uniref:2-methoxy-6-polyprenyl-1,4-benzoquinol methylase, mitochondrial n=1 Tax=Cronartium quercuum f. sp. fusiforme G11 TaxID=708437 RepID=A0A9P6NBR0_9BASI|nr:hypothetical protein CROQUDRAFT_660902 [Cronartium quercuum f. sp. fusiforme G11]
MGFPAVRPRFLLNALPSSILSVLPRVTCAHGLRTHVTSSAKQPIGNGIEGDPTEPRTHFGYKEIPESTKKTLVGQVFSSVASSYDIMNDAMSLGIHRLWKDHFVKSLNPHGRLDCLDVAGGTADIALRILDHARLVHSNRETRVTILDINPEMLTEGQKKVNRSMYYGGDQVSFKLGDAQDLLGSAGIPDESVDLYTIAFGIRNCTKVEDVLKEAFRVLRKGGRFSCLEFGKVEYPVLASLYEAYSFNVIPNLGHILAADRDSYQYLVESIRRFPPQAKFAQMIQDAGFQVPSRKRWEDLSFGIASIHNGVKL